MPKDEAYRIQYNEDSTVFSITTEDESISTPPDDDIPEDGITLVEIRGKCLLVALEGVELTTLKENTVYELVPCKTIVDTVDFDGEEAPENEAPETEEVIEEGEPEEEEMEGAEN